MSLAVEHLLSLLETLACEFAQGRCEPALLASVNSAQTKIDFGVGGPESRTILCTSCREVEGVRKNLGRECLDDETQIPNRRVLFLSRHLHTPLHTDFEHAIDYLK
jgi:hypothetical protein